MSHPVITTLDIETSPMEVYSFGLFNQNLGINQIIRPTRMLSFAAKRYDKKKVEFYSTYHNSAEEMVKQAYRVVDQSDIIVHFNGTSFDLPHLNREFIQWGLGPASPVREVDLLKVVKKNFRFNSNKLDHVSQELGLEGKTPHTGFQLWRDCLAGDEKAWNLMRKYNKQDVVLTEELYDKLRPWISNHPHYALYLNSEVDLCNRCGSEDLERRGYAYTDLGKYQQYKCRDCGGWSRGKRSVQMADARGVK